MTDIIARPLARPPFDPELEAALVLLGDMVPRTFLPEMIPFARQAPLGPPADEVLAEHGITRRDVTFPGHLGDEIVLSVLQKDGRTGLGPGIYHTHGGGMVVGDRFFGVEVLVDWIERYDAVCVTVEYRLAPEFPDPYPVEDSYAGLLWTSDHAEELGIDPDRLIVAGLSAGGGLAAGLALLHETAAAQHSPGRSSCARCSTTATPRCRPGRSTASASGIERRM